MGILRESQETIVFWLLRPTALTNRNANESHVTRVFRDLYQPQLPSLTRIGVLRFGKRSNSHVAWIAV